MWPASSSTRRAPSWPSRAARTTSSSLGVRRRDGTPASMSGIGDGDGRRVHLEAAVLAAVALRSVVGDAAVPDLTGEAPAAAHERAVLHDRAADAGAHVEPDERGHVTSHAEPRLGERRCMRSVPDRHRNAQGITEQLDDGHVLPSEVGREHAHAGLAVDETRHHDRGVPDRPPVDLRLAERVGEECRDVLERAGRRTDRGPSAAHGRDRPPAVGDCDRGLLDADVHAHVRVAGRRRGRGTWAGGLRPRCSCPLPPRRRVPRRAGRRRSPRSWAWPTTVRRATSVRASGPERRTVSRTTARLLARITCRSILGRATMLGP